jgi:hypothetical protein
MTSTVAMIVCPYCKRDIPLDEALTHQITEKLTKEFNEEVKRKEKDFKTKEQALIAKEKELLTAREEQEQETEKLKNRLQTEYAAKLTTEKKKMEETAKKKAEEEISGEMKLLKEEIDEKSKQVKDFKTKELQLRKEKQRIEEEKQNLELDVARKIDQERNRIREDMVKKLDEQHRLKDAEKDKLMDDMKNQIEDLKRKAEQGSQQLQGEILEIQLEDLLRANFKYDIIEPVQKGMRGADVIQRVCTASGQPCGAIIWESKRTKTWSDGWIAKLKDDQREAGADIAALISTVLPKGISCIDTMNGVWIADYTLAVGLAAALRHAVIEVAAAKRSVEGRSEKLEMLYDYLSGTEFRRQIEAIVETFVSMREDLDRERRSMEKSWAKREKQIERVVKSTSRMYGSLQGIIGSTLPELKSLEIKALEGEIE